MVRTQDVRQQLKRIGVNFQFLGHAELDELPHILFDNEQIQHAVRGRYEGGFAVLVTTNYRVLLIDKKLFYLTIEDMRYDMIADVEFNHRLVDATVRLGTVNKTLRFTAYSHGKLRLMTSYIQQQVMTVRQRQETPVQQTPSPQTNFAPQFQDVATDQLLGQSALQGIAMAADAPINPYNSPVIIKRRVSRFY